MAKLVKYWKTTDNKPDWVEIENELCLPFSPKEQLSQWSKTTNPILVHSKEVWPKVHKMYKLVQYVQIYASLGFNHAIHIGKMSVYWRRWHSSGVFTIGDLFKNGQFMYSYILKMLTNQGLCKISNFCSVIVQKMIFWISECAMGTLQGFTIL